MVSPGRLVWQEATVTRIVAETPTVKSLVLRLAEPWAYVAGQHVDVRLTAPDGYRAERSYSIASAPDGSGSIELAIEKLEDGEVSPFFHDVVEVGDGIELRGPIGGHFNWLPEDGGPVLLVGGGSGVVPLASILRCRAAAAPDVPMTLVYSARSLDDVIFREELLARAASEPGFSLRLTLTREPAPVAGHRHGRIDRALIDAVLAGPAGPPRRCFVCGANAFVEVATMFLVDAGIPPGAIRTERYGGSPAPDLSPSTVMPEA